MSKKSTFVIAVIAVIASGTLVLAALSSEPGRFVVWGSDNVPLVVDGAPGGAFLTLAAGGSRQTLAIRADRTLYLNPVPEGPTPAIPEEFAHSEFCAVGTGRDHGLAIRPDGTIVAWPLLAALPIPATDMPPTTGQYVAVTGAGGFYSVALDTNGNIVMWGGSRVPAADVYKVIGVGPPMGRFKALAARGRYTLALSEDGTIYGWGTDGQAAVPGTDFRVFTSTTDPWTADGVGHFVAPMEANNPYTAIAAGLDLVVALRADGSAVQWALASSAIPAPPADVAFTQIAAGNGFAAGIDQAGHLHAWGRSTIPWVGSVPAGIYSELSAATGHVAAIETPRGSVWPPNHKMTTVNLTFRVDDNCSPVPLAGLSVQLRSNQPDSGFDSGNTDGDTNGEDGYTSPVVLPATAISQNGDGSFTATFQVRAERSDALPGTRIYSVAVVSTDGATPPNTRSRMTAQIAVEHGGQ